MANGALLGTDAATLGDLIPGAAPTSLEVSDTVTTGETSNTFYGATVTPSDTITISEASTLLVSSSSVLGETVSVADSVQTFRAQADNVSDTVALSEAESVSATRFVAPSDSVSFAEQISFGSNTPISALETVALSEGTLLQVAASAILPAELISVADNMSVGATSVSSNGTNLTVHLSSSVRVEGVTTLTNYELLPAEEGAFPVSIVGVECQQSVLESGTDAEILSANSVRLPGVSVSSELVGSYLFLSSPLNPVTFARVTSIAEPDAVFVDTQLVVTDPLGVLGEVPYELKSSIETVLITTSKPTNGKSYSISVSNLKTGNTGAPFDLFVQYTASAPRPQVASVESLEDGQVIVTFSDPMLDDTALTGIGEYSFTGPSAVSVVAAQTLSATQVLLHTLGFEEGDYTLTVNASGTPHDSAGNPIDPSFNTAVFSSSSPLTARSIFVDKGPIAKPRLVLQSGATATITDAVTVNLPTATIASNMVGLLLRLTTATNGGDFHITSVVSPTRVRVNASFHLPDASNGSIAWQVFDPRDGIIADDPSDVVVRLNGVVTPAEAVVGLLGQIVMSAPPVHGTDVRVDYTWISNPVVDFRRLNSKEFRFNNWNRDSGRPTDASGHKYRYNNTLIRPDAYVSLDIRAKLDQPLQKDLKYRAYERAYTAVLNDPNLLLFNSPTHRIAFPPLQRQIESSFINYQATVLPENEPTSPWDRLGVGTATIVSNTLVVGDTTSGPFPGGNPIFWRRSIDLTFPHVFASAWRMILNSAPTKEGVFTGVACGFSDQRKAVVVGYIDDGGTRKIGILKAGQGNDPSQVSSWTGGIDGSGNATDAPIAVDWSVLHSYRLYRDRDGIVRVYIDGSVVETLRVTDAELPFLEELNDPFNALENIFFGSLSRPATNTSTWEFLRYTILPTNPFQSAPSVFVSYEGTTPPETASQPWTPVGFHGTETIVSNDFLLLDSTSATDPGSEALAGLVSGDFRGFTRLEPLLQVSSDVVLDVNVSLRTFTHGIAPNAVMAAVDDGQRLIQLCFFPDTAAPKFSYGGRALPEAFSPYFWSRVGGASAEMIGQYLRLSDTSTSDGIVYYVDDTSGPATSTRVVSSAADYVLEFRVRVLSHVADPSDFAGVMAHVYDSLRALGVMLEDDSGTKYVTLQSDGIAVSGGRFAFNWDDQAFHTYRLVKNTTGNLVTLFVDNVFLGSVAYSVFAVPPSDPVGMISFGSSTPASNLARSTAEWAYCNCWRTLSGLQRYVGIWKGSDSDSLTGYHLPLKRSGRQAAITATTLTDSNTNFIASGVVSGDKVIVDSGPNKGVYTIASVLTATTISIAGAGFPLQPSLVDYRIPAQTDWTTPHRYRIVRDPGGGVALLFDTVTTPLISLSYSEVDLPPSSVGVPRILAGGLPSITFGAFDPTNVSQTSWDYVRFGITRQLSERGIVPHHQVLNQRNVMASFEHHTTNIPHSHTDFWSESEGIPPQTDPDFLRDPGLIAFTLLNEETPLVPSTQTFEVRKPTPVLVPVAAFNDPSDVLNSQGFLLNNASQEIKLLVPDDVLYNSLQVIERDTGALNLIAPFDDETEPHDWGTLSFQNTVCLTYDGSVLPENDVAAPTPWVRASDAPSHAFASAFSGVLTYGTDATGTRTVYRNASPLPDSIGLQTQVKFKLKLLSDGSGGLGDTQVRFGFSSPGLTMALAFVTSPLGQRYVLVRDLNNGTVVGGIPFDFGDGGFHEYRLVRDPGTAAVQVFIDS